MDTTERSCGACTVCCEGWLVINTDQIKAYPGCGCPDVIPGTGCGMYETRPNHPCRTFFCSWTEDNDMPDWMKPNSSKAIVMRQTLDWNGRKLDLAVPVGAAIPEKTLKWLTNYARTNKRPLVYAEHYEENGILTGDRDIKVFAPDPVREKLLDWFDAGNKFW